MDFIISAMVIDRENVSGATSIIYGKDKKTPIFKTELQPGQGLFQPDLGSNLWHQVTPISLMNPQKIGFRSTIGLDIELVK